MTIECYFSTCPKHSKDEPFCYQKQCTATKKEYETYAIGRSLELAGYNLEDLEKDNPYNQWMYEDQENTLD